MRFWTCSKQTKSNTDGNKSKERCQKITVRILDNIKFFFRCGPIGPIQHGESGRVVLETKALLLQFDCLIDDVIF